MSRDGEFFVFYSFLGKTIYFKYLETVEVEMPS